MYLNLDQAAVFVDRFKHRSLTRTRGITPDVFINFMHSWIGVGVDERGLNTVHHFFFFFLFRLTIENMKRRHGPFAIGRLAGVGAGVLRRGVPNEQLTHRVPTGFGDHCHTSSILVVQHLPGSKEEKKEV